MQSRLATQTGIAHFRCYSLGTEMETNGHTVELSGAHELQLTKEMVKHTRIADGRTSLK